MFSFRQKKQTTSKEYFIMSYDKQWCCNGNL